MITTTDAFLKKFPKAHIGILIIKEVSNGSCHDCLNRVRENLEEDLRSKFSMMSRAELRNQPVLRVYDQYFKLYGQNYPVLYQIESVAIKGRSIPIVNCLVTAMFIAELKNMLLTAGHDFDKVEFPIVADIGDGDTCYTLINDTEKLVCDNDMLICDDKGVISSVIYGPDKRTAITAETQNVLFVVYAPENIDKQDTLSHLEDIKNNVLLFSPRAKIDFMAVSP